MSRLTRTLLALTAVALSTAACPTQDGCPEGQVSSSEGCTLPCSSDDDCTRTKTCQGGVCLAIPANTSSGSSGGVVIASSSAGSGSTGPSSSSAGSSSRVPSSSASSRASSSSEAASSRAASSSSRPASSSLETSSSSAEAPSSSLVTHGLRLVEGRVTVDGAPALNGGLELRETGMEGAEFVCNGGLCMSGGVLP